jgi:hypothetical protein
MDDVYYRVTKEQDAWLRFVKQPPPEPPAHSCGRCRTPFGRSAIPCPNETPNHTIRSADA